MTTPSLTAHLDPSPSRPERCVAQPGPCLVLKVKVEAAHLANPLLAVARLLASEAEAHARVTGDEGVFTVSVALPACEPGALDHAEAWVRWAVHNAGVRGDITRVDDDRWPRIGSGAVGS